MKKKKIDLKKRPGKKNMGNRNPSPKARAAASKAMQGNHYWELRSKHGRDTLFADAQELEKAANEYFQSVDSNPDYRVELKTEGGRVRKINVAVPRPYTIHGLCGYLGCSTSYFRVFKSTCDKDKHKDFLTVIAYVEDRIFNQQFSKASNGFFNGNIISRALGLIDRQDITSGDAPVQAPVINIIKGDNVPPVSNSEDKVK
jgi:hypothetical protein